MLNMFNAAQNIIEKTEALLLKQSTRYKFWSKFTRNVVLPFKYMFMGFEDLFKHIPFFVFTSVSLLAVSGFFFSSIDLIETVKPFMIYICFVVTLILILFAVPTTFISRGVNSKHIMDTVGFINEEDIYTSKEVELLEQNFNLLFESIKSRINLYQWVIGVSWAIYMLFFNLGIRVLLNVEGGITNKTAIMEHFLSFILAILITFVALILVAAYKVANERVMKTIQFACVQQKYDIDYHNDD